MLTPSFKSRQCCIMLTLSLSQDGAVYVDTKPQSRQCCIKLTPSFSQESAVSCWHQQSSVRQCCNMSTSNLSQDSAVSCEPAISQTVLYHVDIKLKGQVQGLGVIFDTISIKVRWEQSCRWNCDLRVINARKQAFSVVPKASPWRWKSCTHMRTTSLLGVAAKWLVATG